MRNFLQYRYANCPTPDHIWCGVSVEDQSAKSRIHHLRTAPVGVRFLSLEPLLGPVGDINLDGISWVIVGGESGPHARPMRPEWVREIRDCCARAGVPFFFKQWGGRTPKAGGRELEGVVHNAMPKQSSVNTKNQRPCDILMRAPPQVKLHSTLYKNGTTPFQSANSGPTPDCRHGVANSVSCVTHGAKWF